MLHPKVAVIDLGTNTTKCSIAAVSGDSLFSLDERIEYNRLGEGLRQSGIISATAMQRTRDMIRKLLDKIRLHRVDDVRIVGTMALRTARNAGKFVDLIRRETGLEVEILDAHTEALYSYLAAQSFGNAADGNALVFDIGGGSTELIRQDQDGALHKESAELGVVTLTERFGAHDRITEQMLLGMMDYALIQLCQYLPLPLVDGAVGLGGSVHTLRDLLMHSEQDQNIGRDEVESMMQRLGFMSLDQRRSIPAMPPQRADVMIAGLVIIHAILMLQSLERFSVCPWGMRHGLLLSRTQCKTIIRS